MGHKVMVTSVVKPVQDMNPGEYAKIVESELKELVGRIVLMTSRFDIERGNMFVFLDNGGWSWGNRHNILVTIYPSQSCFSVVTESK